MDGSTLKVLVKHGPLEEGMANHFSILAKMWEILLQMGIPDHFTCLLISCVQVKMQQLEQYMEQMTGSKLGKEDNKAGYFYPVYLTYMQSISWDMSGQMQHKLKSSLLGKNINNLSYADDTTLMAEKGRTKEPLDESERGE